MKGFKVINKNSNYVFFNERQKAIEFWFSIYEFDYRFSIELVELFSKTFFTI